MGSNATAFKSVDEPTTESERLERVNRGQKAAKVKVEFRPTEAYGALGQYRKANDLHKDLAMMFKSLYEALYGGLGGTMDPSREQVDKTLVAHDGGMAGRIDRADKMRVARESLTKRQYDLIVATVCMGYRWKELPASLTGLDILPQSARQANKARAQVEGLILNALDKLAVAWGYATR